MLKIEEYITIEGKSPFADWFNGFGMNISSVKKVKNDDNYT
jgi:hypothetical protein